MSKIQLSKFIKDYLHPKWLEYNNNSGSELKITVKPKDIFNNDLNLNGFILDKKYEYHSLVDSQSIVIVRTYRFSPLAVAICATVTLDAINPFAIAGFDNISLQAIDVNLINAIENSTLKGSVEFEGQTVNFWN